MCFSQIAMGLFTYPCIVMLLLPSVPRAVRFISEIWSNRKQKILSCLRTLKEDHRDSLWEYAMVSIQIIVTVSALLLDLCKRYVFINEKAAEIFLSIHATIFAIPIALLALVSGILDKSYMGIYYTDYFFNLKPIIYRQKRIIFASLGSLFMCCLIYLLKLYNTVGAFLVFEITLITASTKVIYRIFEDQEQIKLEITEYSLKKQFEANSLGKKTSIIMRSNS